MKFLKNVLLIALCVMLVLPTLPAFAATTVVYDDFESYEATGEIRQNEKKTHIAGDWFLQQNGNPLNSAPKSGIMEHNGGKAITITGITENPTKYPDRQNYVAYYGDRTGLNGALRYSFDFEKSSVMNGLGIRLMLDDTMGTYYSLWISGNKDTSVFSNSVWAFYKFGSGAIAEQTLSAEKISAVGTDSLKSGSVEIIVDGGSFSWTVEGTLANGSPYHATGAYVDANPIKVVETTHEGFFATANVATALNYIDNFKIETVKAYLDFAPANALMKNVADGTNVANVDGSIVRKVYLPSAANSTVALDMDGKTVNAAFDAEGWWTYVGDVQPASVLTVPDTYDCTNMLVLVDAEATYSRWMYVDTPTVLMYPLIGGSMDATTMTWTSSDDKIASVDEYGYVTGHYAGEVIITVEKNGLAYSCPLTVKGELDKAVDLGTLDAYLADKKPVIDALNGATTQAEMEAVLTGTDNASLSYIRDLDLDYMNALLADNTKLAGLATKMLTHKDFALNGKDDLAKIKAVLDKEVSACYFDGVTDIATQQGNVDTYYEYLDLNYDHYYYLMYKDATATAMLNQVYDDAIDVKETMEEAYVMLAFADSIAYAKIQDILTKCEEEIGYNKALLQENGITEVSKYLLDNKANITTRAQLKAAIDGYVAPGAGGGAGAGTGSSSDVGTIGGGGSTGGFGFGGGGNLGYTGGNSFAADKDLVQDAQEIPFVDNTPIFTDVDAQDWFFEAVAMLKGKGIVNGYEDGSFGPDASVTRAEYVKMLLGVLEIAPVEVAAPAEGEEAAPAEQVFTDVAEADWHYGYMMAAYENGLIYGDENGAANPDALITREEMATMIKRAMDLKAVPFEAVNKGQVFADDAAISDWAYSAVIAVKNAGIINGYADGAFRPADHATRAESAQVLSGFATTLDAAIEAAEAAAAQAAAEAEA